MYDGDNIGGRRPGRSCIIRAFPNHNNHGVSICHDEAEGHGIDGLQKLVWASLTGQTKSERVAANGLVKQCSWCWQLSIMWKRRNGRASKTFRHFVQELLNRSMHKYLTRQDILDLRFLLFCYLCLSSVFHSFYSPTRVMSRRPTGLPLK